MKIVSIIGARPQFIKAYPFSKDVRKYCNEIIIHTGQHYDYELSDVFFDELNLPTPDYNLNIGSDLHGKQTAAMLEKIEEILISIDPNIVVVYGDTNSTLAGAMAAAKLNIPVAHIESGLRSFNKKMPEEINRILTDHISEFHFVPSENARINLQNEGIDKNVFVVGDIMLDVLKEFSEIANSKSNILDKLNLKSQYYFLTTIHRPENTDDQNNLQIIFKTLSKLSKQVIFPIHPRTKLKIEEYNISIGSNINIIDPVGYIDSICLLQNAYCLLTDSGGMQKEGYYLRVPTITLRNETEWIETLATGWNKLTGANSEKILRAVSEIELVYENPHPELYCDGETAKKIVDILINSKYSELRN